MFRIRTLAWLTGLLLVLLTLSACGPKTKPPEAVTPEASLAVAGFSNPQYNWELLAGCMPAYCNQVDDKTLSRLNGILNDELLSSGRQYFSPSATRQCQEIVSFEQGRDPSQANALKYWLTVGRCVPTKLLLVPQLMLYQERVGSAGGVQSPASVIIYFYLLDVEGERVAGQYVYEETQESLTSNLLEAGKFFERGAKWVTAEELVREAVKGALKEFGL